MSMPSLLLADIDLHSTKIDSLLCCLFYRNYLFRVLWNAGPNSGKNKYYLILYVKICLRFPPKKTKKKKTTTTKAETENNNKQDKLKQIYTDKNIITLDFSN